MNIVEFPKNNLADIPQSLRHLAESIEKGERGACHKLAWVIDEGNGVISVGLLGHSLEPGAVAYYMLGLAQRNLEQV